MSNSIIEYFNQIVFKLVYFFKVDIPCKLTYHWYVNEHYGKQEVYKNVLQIIVVQKIRQLIISLYIK